MKNNIEDICELLIGKIPEKHKSIILFYNVGSFAFIEPENSTYDDDLIALFGGKYYYLITKDTFSSDRQIFYYREIYTDNHLIESMKTLITVFVRSLDRVEKAAFVMYRERKGMISARMFSNKIFKEV